MRRPLAVLVLVLLVAACSQDESDRPAESSNKTSTSTNTSTSTTSSSITTDAPPLATSSTRPEDSPPTTASTQSTLSDTSPTLHARTSLGETDFADGNTSWCPSGDRERCGCPTDPARDDCLRSGPRHGEASSIAAVRGETMQLSWSTPAQPQTVDVIWALSPISGGRLVAANPTEWVVEIDPGEYSVQINVSWPHGDTQHHATLTVRPAG